MSALLPPALGCSSRGRPGGRMLTCHHQGCQDANRGSCGPKDKQLGEEVPQGEEEGPECDVVQPTREQTDTGTGGLFVQCRGQTVVRLLARTHTRIQTPQLTMAKGKGDLGPRKTCLLDHTNLPSTRAKLKVSTARLRGERSQHPRWVSKL